MNTIIKIILFLIVLAVVTPILIFQYFFNSGPRDLGIKYTPENYTDAHNKIGVEVSKLDSAASPKDSLIFSGKKETNIVLDSSEVTAYLNAETWRYAPFSNVQVKINPNGTGEISGVLNINNVLPFISMTTPIEQVNQAIDKFKITNNPPFYAQGSLDIVNNKVALNIMELQIGKIPVPSQYISENLGAIQRFAEDRLSAVPNLMVRKFNLSGGKVNIDATVPEKLQKLQK